MSQRPLSVYCQNIHKYVEISGGDTLLDIYRRISTQLDFTPICARVNNKSADLHYPVFAPKTIEFMPVTSPSGNRTYIRSLCMMLYHAVNACLPEARLVIEHSLSRGYYCRITGVTIEDAEALAQKLKAHMQHLVEADMPFHRLERRTAEVIEIFRRQHLDDKVKLLQSLRELYTVYYQLGDLYDSYYGQLAPYTGMLATFDIRPYKEGFLLLGPDNNNPAKAQTPTPQEKMYEAFTGYVDFNHIVGVSNVGELNEAVSAGESAMLINVSEALHNNRISAIADDITLRFRQGGARIVMIAGPSSLSTVSTPR